MGRVFYLERFSMSKVQGRKLGGRGGFEGGSADNFPLVVATELLTVV